MEHTKSELFNVRSVAIIGASEEAGKIGSGLYRSIAGSFPGEIYCVNPGYDTLWGRPCYRTVLELPETPSHAVIAVARRFVPGVLAQIAEKGIHYVVCISAGFKETDEIGAQMERKMQEFCREHDIVLLGPNCLGFIDTSLPYYGTFLMDVWHPGHVSVISQSGGVGMALLGALDDQKCGISRWVGVGNEAVVDAVDMLEILADDPATRAIGVCFEGLRDLPGFLKLAKIVNKKKPIVVLRDGKGQTGRQAAASHTGTMAQKDEVMVDLIRQAGLLEAESCRECAAMLKALAMSHAPAGDRTLMLSNTAGPAILAADVLERHRIPLPIPTQELRNLTDDCTGIKMGLKNPADISSHGLDPRTYGAAVGTMLGSDEYDILMSFFSLGGHLIVPSEQMMAAKRDTGKPVVAVLLGKQEDFLKYDRLPETEGIPCYYDVNDAAAAVRALVHWGQVRRNMEQEYVPQMSEEQRRAAASYIEELPEGIASERCARKLLSLAGIPVEVPVRVTSADEAVSAAEAMGYPVVLKVESAIITHKSDVGGVRLNLASADEVRSAYGEMICRLQALDPAAAITVQSQAPEGFELILGGARIPQIGPLVMVGMGGIYSEVLADVHFSAPALGMGTGENLLSRLSCAPILQGYRGRKKDAAGAARIADIVGELMELDPAIAEIDMNPCRVYEDTTRVLDARVIIKRLNP